MTLFRKVILDGFSLNQAYSIFRNLPSVPWVPKMSSVKFSDHLPQSAPRRTSRFSNLRKLVRISCQLRTLSSALPVCLFWPDCISAHTQNIMWIFSLAGKQDVISSLWTRDWNLVTEQLTKAPNFTKKHLYKSLNFWPVRVNITQWAGSFRGLDSSGYTGHRYASGRPGSGITGLWCQQ